MKFRNLKIYSLISGVGYERKVKVIQEHFKLLVFGRQIMEYAINVIDHFFDSNRVDRKKYNQHKKLVEDVEKILRRHKSYMATIGLDYENSVRSTVELEQGHTEIMPDVLKMIIDKRIETDDRAPVSEDKAKVIEVIEGATFNDEPIEFDDEPTKTVEGQELPEEVFKGYPLDLEGGTEIVMPTQLMLKIKKILRNRADSSLESSVRLESEQCYLELVQAAQHTLEFIDQNTL